MPAASIPKRSLKRWYKLNYYRLVRMKDSPHKVAGGMALGIFLGIMPGAGTVAALVLATLLKLNRGAAVIGTLIFNTATTIPVWILSYSLGSLILGNNGNVTRNIYRLFKAGKFMQAIEEGGISLVIGVLLTSLVMSLVCYVLTYKLMVSYQKHAIKRMHHKHHP